MHAVLLGSAGQSVTWTVRYSADRNAVGTEVVIGGTTTTSITTGDTIVALDAPSIPSGSWVWLETTAQSGIVDALTVTLVYEGAGAIGPGFDPGFDDDAFA
jgi:hypothetical protein